MEVNMVEKKEEQPKEQPKENQKIVVKVSKKEMFRCSTPNVEIEEEG